MREKRNLRNQPDRRAYWLRCALALSIVMLLLAGLWQADLSAVGGLFQSPQTSTPEPASPTSTAEPASPTPTVEATVPETVEEPTAEPPTPTAVEPTEPPTVTPAPTETPTPSVTPEPAQDAGGLPGGDVRATEQRIPEDAEGAPERYAESDSKLGFDWGRLLDSMALLLSYVWLICGVVLFIAVGALFLVLWLRTRQDLGDGTGDEGELPDE